MLSHSRGGSQIQLTFQVQLNIKIREHDISTLGTFLKHFIIQKKCKTLTENLVIGKILIRRRDVNENHFSTKMKIYKEESLQLSSKHNSLSIKRTWHIPNEQIWVNVSLAHRLTTSSSAHDHRFTWGTFPSPNPPPTPFFCKTSRPLTPWGLPHQPTQKHPKGLNPPPTQYFRPCV